jgi:hypothetical protein
VQSRSPDEKVVDPLSYLFEVDHAHHFGHPTAINSSFPRLSTIAPYSDIR